MDLPFTELPEGRAIAVFFKHLFFHWEKADEFTFREAHLTHTALNLSLDAEPNGKLLSCPAPAIPPLPHLAPCMSSVPLHRHPVPPMVTTHWHSFPDSCLC